MSSFKELFRKTVQTLEGIKEPEVRGKVNTSRTLGTSNDPALSYNLTPFVYPLSQSSPSPSPWL